jgi:cytochrome c oxidase cbb3-type subunit 2
VISWLGRQLARMPLAFVAVGASLAFGLGTAVTVVLPAFQMVSLAPSAVAHPYTPLENRGRWVYFREGCWYCHTQQVRPVLTDRAFGQPVTMGDYAYDDPQPMGTERTGADLSHEGTRIPSATWQLDHLRNPEKMVPGSVMPSYAYLSPRDQRALVAYLLSLR